MKHKRMKLGRKEQIRTEEERNFGKMKEGVKGGGRKERMRKNSDREEKKKK